MDLAKLHEGHIRVLEGQLAAQKQALGQASLKETALVREREAAAQEAKQAGAKLTAAMEQLDSRKRERREAQTLVSKLLSNQQHFQSSWWDEKRETEYHGYQQKRQGFTAGISLLDLAVYLQLDHVEFY